MKKSLLVFTGFLLLFNNNLLFSTEKKSSNTSPMNSEAPLSAAAKRYTIKSGEIHYNAPMGTSQEFYFDNYGDIELFITIIDLGGFTSKTIEIRKEGFVYSYDEGKKIGTKKSWVVSGMDYTKADAKAIARYKIKDLGTEMIAGKECKKFSAEFGNSPLLTWTWNNIMIKSITKMANMDFTIEAVKIEEKAIDPKKFELPAGVTFK